jgi:hypothetical protein
VLRNSLFALVAHERRRYVLYLLEEEPVRTVEALAIRIEAWEREVPVADVPEAKRREVETSLVHKHLPKLADSDVVNYDPRSGDVVLGERPTELEPLLDVARRYDGEPGDPGQARE